MLTCRLAGWLLLAGMMFGQTVRFDQAAAGASPRNWTPGMTHEGGPPKWEMVYDGSSRVLAQTSTDATAGRFPFLVYDRAVRKNGSVSVRFKPMSGVVDQAAGLIWRFRDAGNYYLVRANALEQNVVLYKVEKGERRSLAPRQLPSRTYGVKHRIPKREWSTLKVEFRGPLFRVSINGEKVMEVEDSTFTGAGKMGLWTKADSVIYFDDFRVGR